MRPDFKGEQGLAHDMDMMTDRYIRPTLPYASLWFALAACCSLLAARCLRDVCWLAGLRAGVPTQPADDILRARIQTLGVAEHVFEMNLGRKSVIWRLFDVGLVDSYSSGLSAKQVVGGGSQAPPLCRHAGRVYPEIRNPVEALEAMEAIGALEALGATPCLNTADSSLITLHSRGARGQRHTWMPFFDDANAIIFLAPISAFDQYLEEDYKVRVLIPIPFYPTPFPIFGHFQPLSATLT